MLKKKIVVVGGVAGGMSFATRYRRLNQNDDIIVIDKGPYVSFANCGLPYYISGVIDKRSKLIVAKEEMLKNRFNIDVRSNTEAISINPSDKTITTIKNGVVEIVSYDKLVLSPGAKPFVLPINGLETTSMFTLRNIPDVDRIMHYIDENNPKSVAVIGAGFIGLEVAENLKEKGLDVTIIEKAPHVLGVLDEEMAIFAHHELIRNGIKVYTNNAVVNINKNELTLETNEVLHADFIIMSIGVKPENDLAQNASITLGMRGGILVDENYQTSVKDIYAIGDAIIVKNYLTHADTMIALASPANRQGRRLADILSGKDKKNTPSLGTSILKLFDLSFAQTGLNERSLKGQNYQVMHLLANDHAGYYPGFTGINLKVIFNPETKHILGAQAVGKKGVDKRIDVLATAIKAQMKIDELQELELTYAPPFGTAKDIVNMVGYVAQNMMEGLTKTIQYHEVERFVSEGATLIDVRNLNERARYGYIKDSIHIEIDQLRQTDLNIPKDKPVILYCESGIRSYNGEQYLRSLGYDVYNLDGSFSIYSKIYEKKVVKDV